ncbi:MAG: glycosyltransferase family 8 protein [Lachnospiraceae bacterium]|nr:glycosyltransferase family 8 protein [Lachnospiraceae bacterium]
MEKINVIYQFNEKYAAYAGVSLTSLLINNEGAPVDVMILADSIGDATKERFTKTADKYGARIFFPDTVSLMEEFREMGMIPYRGTYSVYLRLFFTKLSGMPDLAGQRVLYLDADTIVDKNLQELFATDMEDKSIGMVLESLRDNYKVMIGMSPSSDYYNSGMILYDVDRWAGRQYPEKLVDHIKNVRSSYIGDQDFLNIVCEGDVYKLPPTYNFQPLHGRYSLKEYESAYGLDGYYTAEQVESACRGAAIYHCYRWLGEFTWDLGNLHPFTGLFDKYLERSLWSGYVKTKAKISAVIKLEKVMYRTLPKGIFIRIFKKMHELMLKGAEADARAAKANDNA